jgi:hypothetical protein
LTVTEVTLPLKSPVLLVSNRIVVEGDDRFAVPLNAVTRLLNWSRTSKFTTADATPATTVCAAVVITTWV